MQMVFAEPGLMTTAHRSPQREGPIDLPRAHFRDRAVSKFRSLVPCRDRRANDRISGTPCSAPTNRPVELAEDRLDLPRAAVGGLKQDGRSV